MRSDRKHTGISLKNVTKYLQKGEITEVANEIGITQKAASDIIAGRSTNWAFAEKIIERAEKNKAIKERAESF